MPACIGCLFFLCSFQVQDAEPKDGQAGAVIDVKFVSSWDTLPKGKGVVGVERSLNRFGAFVGRWGAVTKRERFPELFSAVKDEKKITLIFSISNEDTVTFRTLSETLQALRQACPQTASLQVIVLYRAILDKAEKGPTGGKK